MTAECYECATAEGMAEHDGRKSLNVIEMMRIGADDCVKCECNTHYAKNESEDIPAKSGNGRAERSREKMNEQRVRMIMSDLRHFLLSPSLCEIFVGSNRNAPWQGVVREHGCVSLRLRDEEGRTPK
ncbi:MAG: hypothetical protein MW690_001627 [Methanophagales archaeon]|nr:hypothetical protein [Methanophagales archaeon]MCU4140151.1 hypothetical protein [Methanophagales archaeon]